MSLMLSLKNLKRHLFIFQVDMLNNSFNCPESSRPHRRDLTEVCADRNHICFRIILAEDYCYNVEEDCWVVVNVKPA